MFMTIMTFIAVGIVFIISHFFNNELWVYYVPAALISLSIWLKIIQPAWNADDFQMPSSKMEPSAAAGYLSIIAIIYGILSLIMGYWIPLILCIVVFFLSLTMKFDHPY